MKRLLFFGFLLLTVLGISLWGNRLVERALDAELGALLSKKLGVAVELAPVQTSVLRLKISSPRLVMGDPQSPALVATDITISLSLKDLLHRQIRLLQASASDLALQPSRWPGSDKPPPTDYSFLDPYLPETLQLASGRYAFDDDNSYEFAHLRWRRAAAGGAMLAWRAQLGTLAFDANLESLEELLRLSRMKLTLSVTPDNNSDPGIEVTAELQPDKESGYQLESHISGAGMTAHLVAGNTRAWQLPAHSTTRIDRLDISRLHSLLSHYTAAAGVTASTGRAPALSKLSLPGHQGHVMIDEIRFRKETATASAFDFTTSAQGINISSITSQGPAGILQGHIDIDSADEDWQLEIAADVSAKDPDQGLAGAYLDSTVLWRSGKARLKAHGNTWTTLLDSMAGGVQLRGSHRGRVETPFSIDATLDNRPDEFALEDIEIKLAGGLITGHIAYSGSGPRVLNARLHGDQLGLDFLLAESGEPSPPGLALPGFLAALPETNLDLGLQLSEVKMGAVHIARTDINLVRTPESGLFTAQLAGSKAGTLDLRMTASMFQDKPGDFDLKVTLNEMDLPTLFGQGQSLFDSRTSGTISFSGQGDGIEPVFKAMRGRAELSTTFRPDNDGKTSTSAGQQLRIAGNARLIIKDRRITGIQISELIVDSLQQNLTGTVSLVDGREPWLIAELQSDKLDIPGLLALKSSDDSSQQDILGAIRKIPAMRLSLDARQVTLDQLPLTDLSLQVSSAPDSLSVDKLDFAAEGGQLNTSGSLIWKGQQAQMSANATASQFDLDRFLIVDPSGPVIPVTGTLDLRSAGASMVELLGGLTGDIHLEASERQTADPAAETRRQLDMKAKRTPYGMEAIISNFQWGENQLAGSLRYHKLLPPRFELEISEGTVSLLPWEDAYAKRLNKDPGKKTADISITGTARASADFLGRMLMAPIQLVSGDRKTLPGEKLFSAVPISFDWLSSYNGSIKGKLDSVTSREGVARDLEFSASLQAGRLSAEASAGYLNEGSARLQLAVDTTTQPASATLDGSFEGVRGIKNKDSYPRSGYVSVSSRGQSQAELAGNLDGLVYLELGKGTLDYRNLMLLTDNAASSVLNTLIPGSDKKQPELQCGVSMAIFKDGTGITPYGYAARTREANLVGRIEVDLKTELLQLDFSSSSRKGMGLSVGSVFANTVQLKGPLTDPQIMPNTIGILWRGWAAVMTGGLSVVGESVLKRALASEDPCLSISKEIRKVQCAAGQPAAASPLVCPPQQ